MSTHEALPPQSLRAPRWALAGPALVAGLSVLIVALGILLAALSGLDLLWPIALTLPAIGVPAAIGVLIARRRPGNRLAWVLVADALLLALASLAEPYAEYALVENPGSLPAGSGALLWSEACWPTLFAGAAALGFLFPDGHLPGPRWRPVALAAAGSTVLVVLLELLRPDPFPARFGVDPPLASLPEAGEAVVVPATILFAAGLVAAAAAAATRLLRARGIERLQLLWLAYGALLLPIAIGFCFLWGALGGTEDAGVLIVVLVAATAPPLAAGIAIVRHGLLDIELVLSRTLLYATLTAILAGICIAIVVALNAVLSSQGLAGVAAAVVAATAVLPLRQPLQRRIDRLVYGDRSDPYAALARLGRRLKDAPATSEVLPVIVDSVAEALRPAHTAIELESDGVPEVAASRGRPGRGSATAIPLTYRGETVGRLLVEPRAGAHLSTADLRLLEDLAGQAGVAAHAVRLTADLQRSRERLVTTREEERRRLRHDLHDGIGPTLAAMVLGLGAAGRAVHHGSGDRATAERLLAELRGQAKDAIGEVRRIVDGLGPAALDELGLMEALRIQTARLVEGGGPEIEVRGPDARPQLPAAVEVAAYRIASEALTNVARHAGASRCDVSVAVGDALVMTVADDGVGIPAGRGPGVGLRSMRERAAELGGTLEVGSGEGGGTVLWVSLPLEAR